MNGKSASRAVNFEPSKSLPIAVPATSARMEAALVLWHDLWWRSPGAGRSPFAKDGPWHLARREAHEVAEHYSLTLITLESGREIVVRKLERPRPRAPLDARETAVRDQIGRWIDAIPDDRDRKAAVLGTRMLWRGEGAIGWSDLAPRIGWDRTPRALAERYRRVLCEMICRAKGVPMRHWRSFEARERGWLTR